MANAASLGRSGFRQALALTLVVWFVFVYGSYIVSELIGGRTGFLQELPLDLPAVFLVALLAQALYPLAVVTTHWSAPRRWTVLFGAAVVVALLQTLVNLAENRLLGVIPAFDAAHFLVIRQRSGRIFLSHVYLTFANAALLVFLVEYRLRLEERLRLAQAETVAANAQTAALRLQLNPRFLFNTLNSISSLVVTHRAEQAEEMLARLAEFLRVTLSAPSGELVSLDEEFATAEAYLEIEAVRFGARMRTDLMCARAVADVRVPPFLLQPLVENAVKFGVARTAGTVTVCITAELRDKTVYITVTDDGGSDEPAADPAGLGIGLANIRDRLAVMYGDRASLSLEREPGRFAAIVRLPYDAPAPGQPATGSLIVPSASRSSAP